MWRGVRWLSGPHPAPSMGPSRSRPRLTLPTISPSADLLTIHTVGGRRDPGGSGHAGLGRLCASYHIYALHQTFKKCTRVFITRQAL